MVFPTKPPTIHLTRLQQQIPMVLPSRCRRWLRFACSSWASGERRSDGERFEMPSRSGKKPPRDQVKSVKCWGNDGKRMETIWKKTWLVEVLNKTLLVNVKQVYSWILNGGYSSEKWLNMTLWLVDPLPRVSVW